MPKLKLTKSAIDALPYAKYNGFQKAGKKNSSVKTTFEACFSLIPDSVVAKYYLLPERIYLPV